MSVAVTAGGDADQKFGLRLRDWRRRRGLSQAELGGGKFSGSYVSHVESGRRRATPEMIDYFARQLGLEPEALDGYADAFAGAVDASVLKVASLAIQANRAHVNHDFARAARLADEAARLAAEAELTDRWWFARQQQAQALFEEGEYASSYEMSVELAEHETVSRTTVLRLEALVLATRAARAAGRLADAEKHARAAVEQATNAEWIDYRAEALIVLVGVLMERGQQEDALAVTAALVEIRDTIGSAQLRGVAFWITGIVRFLAGDAEAAVADHKVAETLLRPEVDLRGWGRFFKASAEARLRVGISEDVRGLLDRARQAILLVGNASDRTELRLIEARLALLERRLDEARNLVVYCLEDDSLIDSPHSRAEAEELLADVLLAAGERTMAAAALQRAAELFEGSGALKRSIAAWRAHAELVAGDK